MLNQGDKHQLLTDLKMSSSKRATIIHSRLHASKNSSTGGENGTKTLVHRSFLLLLDLRHVHATFVIDDS